MKIPAHNFKLLFLFCFLAASGISSQKAQGSNMGQVDRVRLDPSVYRLAGVASTGIIYTQSKDGKVLNPCTATAIHKDYVLTAAHCLRANSGDRSLYSKEKFYFAGAYETGEDGKATSTHVSGLTLAATGRKLLAAPPAAQSRHYKRHDDWAILKLDKPFHWKFPRMKVSRPKDIDDLSRMDVSISGYGMSYSQSKYPTYQEKCRIRDQFQHNVLAHDCDTSKGDSGAPLYNCPEDENRCVLYAVNISTLLNYPDDLSFEEAKVSTEFPYYFDPGYLSKQIPESRTRYHRINAAVSTGAFYDEFMKLLGQ